MERYRLRDRHVTSDMVFFCPSGLKKKRTAEQSKRAIMEATRSLLHSKGIPLKLWAAAVNCVVYIINRILSPTWSVTPYETWYGSKPYISHLRILKKKMYIHILDASRQKLDAKTLQCIFMGYCDTSKAYRGWDPVTQKKDKPWRLIRRTTTSYTYVDTWRHRTIKEKPTDWPGRRVHIEP